MACDYRMMEDEEGNISIHEVYYDKAGNVTNWTEKAASPYLDKFDLEDGKTMPDELSLFMEATKKPVLQYVTGKEMRRHDG